MRRWLFTILSALSLLLCLATAALWVRSMRRADRWMETKEKISWDLWACRGRVTFQREVAMERCSFRPYPYRHEVLPVGVDRLVYGRPRWTDRLDVKGGGFRLTYKPAADVFGETEWLLCIPFWFVCLVSGVLPAWWAVLYRRRRLRRKRQRMGLCARCGYDLRASKDRCPECGTPIAPPAPAASA